MVWFEKLALKSLNSHLTMCHLLEAFFARYLTEELETITKDLGQVLDG